MLAKIPFQKIFIIGAVSTGSIYAASRFGQWRKDRIASGESDPMPWAVDVPGGTSTVAAGLMAVGSAYLLKGKNREIGYLAAGVALLPAGRSLLDRAVTSDHAAPTDQQLADGFDSYVAGNRSLMGTAYAANG